MKKNIPYLLLAIVCLGLFFWRLGCVPLMGFDEGIYAECSREMVASGNYLVPSANGQLFFDKPPLTYWLQAGSIQIFGVNSFAVRLPSAITALLLVALTVFLGARIFDRRSGIYAGFILAASMLTAGLARMCLMDQLFALTINAAFAAFLLTYLQIWRRSGYIAFWTAVGLSVLVKGPAGAVLILVTIAAFLLIRRQMGEIRRVMLVPGLLVMVAVAAPWYVMVQQATGGAFLREFIFHQNIARALGKDFAHNMPFYFYLPIYLLGFFPWSVFVPLAWKQHVRLRPAGEIEEAALFVGVAMLSIIVVFSISVSKLPSYIFPMFPASALLMGLMWSRAVEQVKTTPLRRYAIAALVIAVILAAGMVFAQEKYLGRTTPGLAAPLWIMGAGLVVGTACALVFIAANRIRAAFASLCLGTAAFLGSAVIFGLPIASRTLWNPTVEMGRQIQTIASRQDRAFAYCLRPAQPGLGFYAGVPVMQIKTAQELQSHLTRTGINYVVVHKEDIMSLPCRGRAVAQSGQLILYRLDR